MAEEMITTKPGNPVCFTSLVTNAAAQLLYTAPANKRLIVDQIEITDQSAAANTLTITDRFILASGGGAVNVVKGSPLVAANAFLALERVEDLVILNEFRAQSTGNMMVSVRGREI
jgi:hypothetical protein